MAIDRPSWRVFSQHFARRWEQGEHVFIAGQTGSGKTDLLLKILELTPGKDSVGAPLRWHEVVMVTKPRDPIFKTPEARDYTVASRFNKKTVRSYDTRVMLSPEQGRTTAEMEASQHATFDEAFDYIYQTGGWTVGIDELAYMHEQLNLFKPIARLHHMGRALGITCITATQRPKRIPRIVPASASHAFIAKTANKEDLKTLAELGGDPKELEAAIASITNRHEFVYVDTQGELPLAIVNTHK